MQYTFNQKFNKTYPPEAALWCNSNGAYLKKIDKETYQIQAFPKLSKEELQQQALEEAKQDRAEAVANIKVTVDGMVFDGDETSQTRMSRSIVALNDGEKILWVLANNTPVQVTKEQLKQALRLSGEAQTKVWADPYGVHEEPKEDNSLAKIGI